MSRRGHHPGRLFVDRHHYHEDDAMKLTIENWKCLVEEALSELPERLRECTVLQRRLTGRTQRLDIVCGGEDAKTISIEFWNTGREWADSTSVEAPLPDAEPFISVTVLGDHRASYFLFSGIEAVDFKSAMQETVCEALYAVGPLWMDADGNFFWQEQHVVLLANGKVAQRKPIPIDHEAVARRSMGERFGVCPKCGKNDGCVSVGRACWCVCADCRTKWPIGESALIFWGDESQKTQSANAERIAGFEHVRPAVVPPEPIPF
jgi:hypothetical protein